MKKEQPAPCPKCGASARQTWELPPGSPLFYRRHVLITLPSVVRARQCGRCAHVSVDLADRKLLEREYHDTLTRISREALERLWRHYSQRHIQIAIGLSDGYLSRIKSGKPYYPSGPLTALLVLLADDPKLLRRIEEVLGGLPQTANQTDERKP